MNYQNTNTQDIVSYYSLRGIYPNSSLPKDGTAEILDYHVITTTPKPTYDVATEVCEEIAPVNYTQAWSVRPMVQDELDAVALKEQQELETEARRGLSDTAVLVPTDINSALDIETQTELTAYRNDCIAVLDAAHTNTPVAHHKVKHAVKKYK